MHVHGMCRLALLALARVKRGQAKLRKTSKGCDGLGQLFTNCDVILWEEGRCF